MNEQPKTYGLPEMPFEYVIKRDRFGKVSEEILSVKGMNPKLFWENVDAARKQFLETPSFNALNPANPLDEALANAVPPEKCPECGKSDFYDNRTDEKPNWRCKNKKCNNRIFIELPKEEGASE